MDLWFRYLIRIPPIVFWTNWKENKPKLGHISDLACERLPLKEQQEQNIKTHLAQPAATSKIMWRRM